MYKSLIFLVVIFAIGCNNSISNNDSKIIQFEEEAMELMKKVYNDIDELECYFSNQTKYFEKGTIDSLYYENLGYNDNNNEKYFAQRNTLVEINNDPSKLDELLKKIQKKVKIDLLPEDKEPSFYYIKYPFFSEDGKYGVIGYGYYCGNLCAEGYTLLYEKVNGTWQLKITLEYIDS